METAEKSLFSVIDLNQVNDKSPHGLSENEKRRRRSVNFRPVALEDILDYIEAQDIEPELKMALRKRVSRYPHQALQKFADNFEEMVNIAQRKIRKNYVIAVPQDQKDNKVKKQVEPRKPVKARKINLDDMEEVSEPDMSSKTGVVEVELNEAPVTPPVKERISMAAMLSERLTTLEFE